MKNNTETKHKYALNISNNTLKNRMASTGITGCVPKITNLNPNNKGVEVVMSDRNEIKPEQTLSSLSEKISSHGMDSIVLMLIILIPTIPFWQL